MNSNDLIQEGIKHKESRQTSKALDTYKKGLDAAKTDREKVDVWMHVLHIHTDKMLAVLMKTAETFNCSVSDLENSETGDKFEWIFGTNTFKQGDNNPNIENYFKPSDESLFE